MGFSRLSSRHWFWLLTGVLLVWTLVSTRLLDSTAPAEGRDPLGRRIEAPARHIAGFVLAFPAALLEKVQTAWTRVALLPTSPETVDYHRLLEENERLKREALLHSTQIERLENRLLQYTLGKERFPLLSEQQFLPANIIGHSASVASSYCTLDKGTAHGVQRGCPVLLQFALLGRVVEAGPYTCRVQLLTDPAMRQVQARVVRRTAGELQTVVEACLVSGLGNNALRCDTIEVHTFVPQKGDMLSLSDKEWPAAVQGVIIGNVQEVRENELQRLRYDLVIEPAATVYTAGQISIILLNR